MSMWRSKAIDTENTEGRENTEKGAIEMTAFTLDASLRVLRGSSFRSRPTACEVIA